ncbi:MAG: Gldg family protein [Polyangiaceae bacterium]
MAMKKQNGRDDAPDSERDDAPNSEHDDAPASEREAQASKPDSDDEEREPQDTDAPSPANDAARGAGASGEAEAKGAGKPSGPSGVLGAESAPLWVAPLYVLGMVLVFVGQRVLSTLDTASSVVTALGVMGAVGATVLRFLPKYRAGGERREIETLLAVLSVVGLVALALYALTTDTGQDKAGLSALDADAKERWLGVLTILWIALSALAIVPMLFAEGALLPMRRAERPESRRVRAAVVSGFSLVLAAIYGSLFVYAAYGASWKADYSYFKTSEPSDSTKKIAASLSEPVSVIAFYPDVNEIRPQVEGYLRGVAASAPNLQIEVQDRLLIPKKARELRATQDGVVVLSKGGVTESLNIGTDERNARPKLKTLDRDFQEKLLKLVRSRRTVYLTVGHGELNEQSSGESNGRSLRIVRTLLQKQNYLVKDLGLAQGLGSEVPADADVVMALGPTEPFAPEEIASLRRYSDRGGKLLIAVDPDALREGADAASDGSSPGEETDGEGEAEPTRAPAPSAVATPSAAPPASAAPIASGSAKPAAAPPPAPPLEGAAASFAELTRVVGIEYSPYVLANERQHVRRRFNDSDRTLLVTNRFSSHAAVSTLSRNSARAVVVAFGAGSFERAAGATESVDFAVRAMAGTFQDRNKNYKEDDGEKGATFNIAAAVVRKATAKPLKPEAKPGEKPDDKKGAPPPDEMRAFVIADADALSDLVLSNVLGNQVLFLDALRWLGGEESFSGEVNSEEDVRIEHSKEKDAIWFYATLFGAPALVLALGFVLSRRGRRKGARR